jgi:hypothetical protein
MQNGGLILNDGGILVQHYCPPSSLFLVQKIMSTSRRGRHAQRSPEDEAAPTVVENVDGTDDAVPPNSDDEDWEPLSNIEQGSPPSAATDAPTTTTGNPLFVCVLKPVMKQSCCIIYAYIKPLFCIDNAAINK